MYPPLVIAVVSIVPGLGFWLIGQRRRAVLAAAVVVVPLIIIFSPWETVARASRSIAFVAWIAQMYIAADTAKLLNQSAREPDKAANKYRPSSQPPHGIAKNERVIWSIREIAQQQLKENEQLVAAVMGIYLLERKKGIIVQFPARTRYVALTNDHLILIEPDLLGSPLVVERIPRERVRNARFKKGIITDRLQLDLLDSQIDMKVPYYLREQTQVLVAKSFRG